MTPPGPPSIWTGRAVLALILMIEVSVVTAIVAAERRAQRADAARISVFQKAGSDWRKRLAHNASRAQPASSKGKAAGAREQRIAEPIRIPASLAAAEATLRPDEMVVGVEIGGQARAYRLASFERVSGHLVNDLVGDVPVSVAYCDLTRCLRVYSGPPGSHPLDLNVAGVLSGEMIMRHDGRMYFQKSGQAVEPGNGSFPLPFPLISPTLTTWKEWLASHPDTRVYLGEPDDDSSGERH